MKSFFLIATWVALSSAGYSHESYDHDSYKSSSSDESNSKEYQTDSYGKPIYGMPLEAYDPPRYPAPYSEPVPAPYPKLETSHYPPLGPALTDAAYYPQGPGPYPTKEFRELKTLHVTNVVKARIRYYKHDNHNFAIISCPKNPTPGAYTWIVADSKHTTPSFGIPGTVALNGGVNIEFVAKYDTIKGKWEGRDFKGDDKQKFRRVGCFQGSVQSFAQL